MPIRPTNEPILDYPPSSAERATQKAKLTEMERTRIELPLVIDGEEVHMGWFEDAVAPHDHQRVLALAHLADEQRLHNAISAAGRAWTDWSRRFWTTRSPAP